MVIWTRSCHSWPRLEFAAGRAQEESAKHRLDDIVAIDAPGQLAAEMLLGQAA
jgi:hypothetical protein